MVLDRKIVDNDINMLIKKLNYDCDYEKAFHEYGTLYPYTNENLNSIASVMNLGGNVLTVTASGDHQLNAVLNGSRNVTAFDINHLAKYFAELKKEAIKQLSYEDFCKFYGLKYIGGGFVSTLHMKNINPELLEKVCCDMDPAYKYFWKACLIISQNKNIGNLFSLCNDPNNNRYIVSKEDYYLLKEKLINTEINYIECDLLDLPNYMDDKLYSSMLFSNITSYMDDDSLNKTLNLCHTLSRYLEAGGLIQFGYGHRSESLINIMIGRNRVDSLFVDNNKDYLYDVEKKERVITLYKPKG